MIKLYCCIHVNTYLRDVSCYFWLCHRKTCCVCKVQYTPLVPCDPQTNSGNCFQWKWAIGNNPELFGCTSFLGVHDCNGRGWSRASVRDAVYLMRKNKSVWWSKTRFIREIHQMELSDLREAVPISTEWVLWRTHPEEICFQATYSITVCVDEKSLWRTLSREQSFSIPQARTVLSNDD